MKVILSCGCMVYVNATKKLMDGNKYLVHLPFFLSVCMYVGYIQAIMNTRYSQLNHYCLNEKSRKLARPS